MKSLWKSFIAPFSFIWDYSSITAPAREAIEEAEHWSDYVAAALYLTFASCMLVFLALHVSTAFVFGTVGVLGTIVGLKFAWHHFS